MNKFPLYIPVYSLTLLVSAALLFSIQPMFSKMILPLLGGTPQVWNTAMLFFQVVLLAGYAYAHATTKFLSVRAQAILHIALLIGFVFVLPIAIPPDALPPVDRDPTLWQLSLMAATVGGPFFVLAGSAPMFQRWFSQTDHPDADNPYFLYGASNLGSMTALLAYPTIIEPLLNLTAQTWAWETGYIALIILTIFASVLAWPYGKKQIHSKDNTTDEPVSWKRRGFWLLLSFIPSSLMLGVTTFITTDIAAVPLLWILPLALYVSTFIIVFMRKPIISLKVATFIQGILIIVLIARMIAGYEHQNTFLLIALHMTLFFFSALVCHMELANARPGAKRLTEFYLIMSLGGALGGFFNAIVAPLYFIIPLEYALILAATVFIRFSHDQNQTLKTAIEKFRSNLPGEWNYLVAAGAMLVTALSFSPATPAVYLLYAALVSIGMLILLSHRWLFACVTVFTLCFYTPGHQWGSTVFKKILYQDRNFFGVIKVIDTHKGERMLLHGTTNHGAQALDPGLRLTPLSYYSSESPLSDAFEILNQRRGNQEIAIVGLGIGVTACFKKPGRHFDFFEIDPEITAIAENKEYFTFLSGCGSPYQIIPGDGRLTMKQQPDNHYDLILLDAFSSDNVPVHLLTAEAIMLYMQKLKSGGMIVFNVSNNYLDLEPVLTNIADKLDFVPLARLTPASKIPGTGLEAYTAHFFAMTKNDVTVSMLERRGWSAGMDRPGVKLWTDQFSNILSVFNNRTGYHRYIGAKKAQKLNEEKKIQ